jgi:hypothetical protein
MLKTLAAAGVAIGITLSPLAAFAQTDTSGAAMSDKSMAPKKPMAKHHPMHKKPMTKTNMKSDTMKSGDTQQRM